MRTHPDWVEPPGTHDMGGVSVVPRQSKRNDADQGSELQRDPFSAAVKSYIKRPAERPGVRTSHAKGMVETGWGATWGELPENPAY